MQIRRERRMAWLIVFLLALLYIINFMDKAVIGLSAVHIMKEMGLTPVEFGLLNSVFFLLFIPLQLIGGLLADRFQSRRILLIMAVSWSVAMLPILIPAGFGVLLASRMLLGAGEGPTSPVAIHAMYKWFPNEERAIPNAFYMMGPAIAMIVGTPFMVWIINQFGWRIAFGVLGLFSLTWAIVWLVVGREGEEGMVPAQEVSPDARPSALAYLRLVGTRTFIGCMLLAFPSYFAVTLIFSWLPHFLQSALGFTPGGSSMMISFAWMIAAVGPILVSLVSQQMLKRGASIRLARGVVSALLVIGSGVLTVVGAYLIPDATAKAVLLVIALSMSVVCNPMLFTLIGQFSPVSLRGGLIGIFGASTVSAGFIAPLAMGKAIETGATEYQGYLFGFAAFGVAQLTCGVVAALLIDPERDEQRHARRVQELGLAREAGVRALPQ